MKIEPCEVHDLTGCATCGYAVPQTDYATNARVALKRFGVHEPEPQYEFVVVPQPTTEDLVQGPYNEATGRFGWHERKPVPRRHYPTMTVLRTTTYQGRHRVA